MLTHQQIADFHRDGYIVLARLLSQDRVLAAVQAINHFIGQNGIPTDRLTEFRSRSYTPEIRNEPVFLDLANATDIQTALEDLLGRGRVRPSGGSQIALRFPGPVGSTPKPPSGHMDGLGSGTNGNAVGEYIRGFSALAVCILSPLPAINSGNFTVWPGSHRTVEAYLQQHGHQILAQGQPNLDWPHPPVQITGQPGDVVITHHQLIHTAGPNHSPHIRYAVIFRISAVDTPEIGLDALTDIWREWHGVRDALGAHV